MYDVVKARMRDGASLTESIHCLRGLKQGDFCCPLLLLFVCLFVCLFVLFTNELALDIITGGKHGTILTLTLVEIFILFGLQMTFFFFLSLLSKESAEYIVQIL